MSEYKFTHELMKDLRRRLPSAWVVKHNDLRTGGIPDFSVSYGKVTLWIEAKWVPDAERPPEKTFTALQWQTLFRLRGAGFYALGSPRGHVLYPVTDSWKNKRLSSAIVAHDKTVRALGARIVYLLSVRTDHELQLCSTGGCAIEANRTWTGVHGEIHTCRFHRVPAEIKRRKK